MSWSISQAAKETGLSKSTISRAIKAGRVSALRQDDGAYLIEPAELFRVYPREVAQPSPDAHHEAVRNPHEEAYATPSHDVEILRVKLAMTEALLQQERENSKRQQETVEDLRRRLDAASEKVLALAQPSSEARRDAPRNPPQPRRWWSWKKS
ncbi:DNA-binding protein [Paracoccus liaowanqingii]|uniref:DNA-binding protein n=1 Tax=Paracoccus liaowanqingii TaxID=2560053 RepID=A0A4Z1BVK0_9RHOB|nr:DNA-binding protein [Paracoccus liaowanqingii]TGN42971.1 DNA-binding protein [Paracoccus liaowanqingii]